ncbi:MAG: UDP-N-acetylmuramoyl-L-alanine--D-glutamate ligase [bacterium]|nr:UDP-N-acetylmuramoyl-L-alanine--D-glutamate ligase [bacterium]
MRHQVKGTTWWVVGLARSGCAAAALLQRHGATVVGIDDNDEKTVRRRWEREGLSNLALRAFDTLNTGGSWPETAPEAVVISPGVPLTHPRLQALEKDTPILGEMELGASFCDADLVAITGTNGKSTTTEWIAHIIKSSGRRCEALGNLGTPLSQIADQLPDDAAVSLEVSSFQLESVSDFSPKVGLVLNLAPDHLDRYNSLHDYYAAKENLAHSLSSDGTFITWTECPEARAWSTEASVLLFGADDENSVAFFRDDKLCIRSQGQVLPLLEQKDLALQSPPNFLNALAVAATSVALNIDHQVLVKGLRDFSGLNHRQQRVADLNSVRYINDTKATNVHAVCAALNGYDRPVILIVGGSGKGESYVPLLEVMDAVIQVVTVGQEGPAIGQVLQSLVPVTNASSMDEAVKVATEVALQQSQADVMLSPACASFDMFDNYAHRGKSFFEAAINAGAVARQSHE